MPVVCLHVGNGQRSDVLRPLSHQKKVPRVAVRVMEYVCGLARTVEVCRSCSTTAYAMMGTAVNIMLKQGISIVVKMGTEENPVDHFQRGRSSRIDLECRQKDWCR